MPVARRAIFTGDQAMKTQYCVEISFAGCLPEGDEPCLFTSLADARAYAREEARDYRDAGMYVKGSARDGYWIQNDKDSYGSFSLQVVTYPEAI
jgi:hypothetical protein